MRTHADAYWQYEPANSFGLGNPNCDPETWWHVVRYHPVAAYQSPLFGLMVLESPERWRETELCWVENWLHQFEMPESILSWAQEYVLPYIEATGLETLDFLAIRTAIRHGLTELADEIEDRIQEDCLHLVRLHWKFRYRFSCIWLFAGCLPHHLIEALDCVMQELRDYHRALELDFLMPSPEQVRLDLWHAMVSHSLALESHDTREH